jgi:hypothetical protein
VTLITSLLWMCVGFILGVGVTIARYTGLEVDKKLNLVQLLNLAITLVLAVIVNRVFQRSVSVQAMRRQLLLDYVKEVRGKLDEAARVKDSETLRNGV